MSAATVEERGVALVITLIMLSIITFMAITFLVLSQRERTSANTSTDQKIVQMAAETGLNRAAAELTAQMLVLTNWQNMQFLVSTSFVNYAGFNNGLTTPYATNVNYDYQFGGTPYSGGPVELERNEANLLINPRVPVYVVTNPVSGAGEFRFYLDLNRNGRDDRNGTWPIIVTDSGGNPAYLTTNASGVWITEPTNSVGWAVSNNFVGDPEWIGIFERPQEFHSADNRAVARYAYMVVPVGNTLDINYVHNRAKRLSNTGEGFLRNQGASTFEINLAGFLADLNTNIWWTNNGAAQYNYNTNPGISFGWAFSNANDLLTYRYGGPTGIGYQTLDPANRIFANPTTLANAGIDVYSQGPLMSGTSNNDILPESMRPPWSGANNTNHFWTIQDVFDTSKAGPTFPTLLQAVGTSNDSYNAYTYYRLLAQLGSDSAPEHYKMNVNWKNTDKSGRVVPGMETNLIAWTPIDFFTNAADRMFRQLGLQDMNGNLITVTNIPFYEDPIRYGGTNINYYTPAVHRILQLAANMYDATTSRFIGDGPTNYPSVFRPVFRSLNGVASIAGYEEVSNSSPVFLPFLETTNFVKQDQPFNDTVNMYGVPWVIGMKKGFPNFNEISMNNPITCTRKIEFTNSSGRFQPPWQTNQLFDFMITNTFGIEAWNSYTNSYGRELQLIVTNYLTITIYDNQFGAGVPLLSVTNLPYGNNLTFPNGWPGWNIRNKSDTSFQVPLYASSDFTNGIYIHQSPFIVPLNPRRWDVLTNPPMWLTLGFHLQYVLIDISHKPNRVLDFVNLVDNERPYNIANTLAQNGSPGRINSPAVDEEWDTTIHNGSLVGALNQIFVSEPTGPNNIPSDWRDTPQDIAGARNTFFAELQGGVTNYFQTPYSPTRTIYQTVSWEANDPMVHYTKEDMTSTNGYQRNFNVAPTISQAASPLVNLTNLNFAYQPWGGYHLPGQGSPNPNKTFDENYQVKDPMIEQSDDWDTQTNKLWGIGVLGRIHRGTPWQTVFMKPSNVTPTTWSTWGNDGVIYTNFNGGVVIDRALTQPANDYALFDLFTAGINDNATRGQLNVNQTGLAALSAVLSGVNVITNSATGVTGPAVVSPAGIYDLSNNSPSPVSLIWQGINATRANQNVSNGPVFLNQQFQHAGDILATPQLSVASPFLNTNQLNSLGAGGISDDVMERIPQQIMSLLTLNQTPRFVIYSFGQTLHPADHSLVTGGTFNGLCTNYQVTAEIATRAVVRIDGSPDPQWTPNHRDPFGRYYPPRVVVEQYNVLPPF